MDRNKPTDNQLGALYGWYKWRLPGELKAKLSERSGNEQNQEG